MTSAKIIPVLAAIPGNYDLTWKERDAIRQAICIVREKVEEEKETSIKSNATYYVGEHTFRNYKDALMVAQSSKEFQNSFILEKRVYENGVTTTKKFKLSRGQVIGIVPM